MPPSQHYSDLKQIRQCIRARRENLGEVNKLHRGRLAHTHRRKRVVQSKHGPGEGMLWSIYLLVVTLQRQERTTGGHI